MAAEAWADDLGLEHGGEQGGPLAAGDGILARPGRAQARQRVGQRFAGIAGPQRVGRSDGLGGGDGGVEQGVRRGAGLHEGRQRRCRCLHPVDQLVHGKPVRQVAEAGLVDAGADRRQARHGLQPAQALAIEPARGVEHGGAVAAQRAQRMLQQGEQGDGREALVDDADQRLQQAGGRRVAKRRARRIVDVDVPAPELGGDPAREVTVRRHQGGGLALFLQDPAQRQGNDHCLLMRRRAVGARHVLERGSERADPFLGGLGRAHQLGDQQMPRRAGAARPVGNVAPLAPQRLQELAQAELRMGLVELHPASIVHVAVEAGQHDLALRQAGDDRQQLARGRLRAGGAGGDHRRGRRLLAPAHRLGADRLGAPLDGVDLAAFGQHPRPCFADDGEELQGTLPVAGEVALDQAFQPVEGDAFDGELVEQSAELARQRQGLGGRLGNG